MFGGGNGLSLADIAAVTRGNNDGFGGGDGWWALIIILALFGGFGDGNGLFGNRGSSGSSALSADVQRGFDTQGITNKLNGLENGLCSLGYDQLAQMNGINTNIMQTGFGITNAINQANVANMQQGNALTAQIQNCCCTLESLLAQANYNRQADTCSITTAINQAAQNIMQNCNANYRSLHDENVAARMEAKDAQIAQLTSALNICDMRNIANGAVQSAVEQIRPTANPAWIVPNPYANYGFGWGNGCCNGNGYGLANGCC